MRFLITAGGTREYIDPVRFISNASSGRMGYELARAARRLGIDVTLITAPTALRRPRRARIVEVVTGTDMFNAVKDHFDQCDCLIMAAAVSDYKPARPSKTKLKKSDEAMTIKLKPSVDILSWAGRHKKHQFLVGFALEDTSIRLRAEKKMKEKNLDVIVANTPAAIGSDKTVVAVKTAAGEWMQFDECPKPLAATRIIREVHHILRYNGIR